MDMVFGDYNRDCSNQQSTKEERACVQTKFPVTNVAPSSTYQNFIEGQDIMHLNNAASLRMGFINLHTTTRIQTDALQIKVRHSAYVDLNVPNIYFVYFTLIMILSIIAVAFYAIIWLNKKSGGKMLKKLKCKKKKKKKEKVKTFLNSKGEADGDEAKLDKGGRFPGFGTSSIYDGDSMASLE